MGNDQSGVWGSLFRQIGPDPTPEQEVMLARLSILATTDREACDREIERLRAEGKLPPAREA